MIHLVFFLKKETLYKLAPFPISLTLFFSRREPKKKKEKERIIFLSIFIILFLPFTKMNTFFF